MAYNMNKLCIKARELALQHSTREVRSQPNYLWNQFEQHIKSLREFANSLQNQPASCAQHAEEWLLDNADFIEEQALEVKAQLSDRALGYLPLLRKNDVLRIQALCEDYLEQVEGVL